MVRVPTEVTVAERARWLEDLSDALDQAQKLVWRFGTAGVHTLDLVDLAARLESARAEVRLIRLGRNTQSIDQYHPEWTRLSSWAFSDH